MKPQETIEITCKGSDGEPLTFQLVATSQKRGKDGVNKLYPFIPEDEQSMEHIKNILGEEKIEEYVIEAFRRDVQILYFQRAKEDIAEFTEMMGSDSLSGRTITAKYCLAKALLYTTGRKGNEAKGIAAIAPDPKLAMEWMLKSQKCITEQMEETTQEEV